MTGRQRLTFLGIAAAIAVVAVVILVATRGETSSERSASSTPTATPTATATEDGQQAEPAASATPDPGPLLDGSSEQEIDATEGDTVRFRVTSDEDEEVHVHGYDIEKEIPAGKTVPISFKATITGIFEIEFHHSGAVLAQLKVEPK